MDKESVEAEAQRLFGEFHALLDEFQRANAEADLAKIQNSWQKYLERQIAKAKAEVEATLPKDKGEDDGRGDDVAGESG